MTRILTVISELRAAYKAGKVTLGDAAFVLWFELGVWLFVDKSKP
jgi:hypothetical protein